MKPFHVIILLFLLIAACAPQVPVVENPVRTFDPAKTVNAEPFTSEDDFIAFLDGVGSSGGGDMYLARGTAGMDVAESAAPAPAMADGKSLDYSGTNNQVTTVDEADILKTDGEYIYTVTGTTLFVIKAFPGEEAEVVSTIEFDSQPQGLFLSGDTLAVFGNFYDTDWFSGHGIRPRNGMTFLDLYDVSDKKDLALVKEYKLEGQYAHARMHEDIAYLVLTSYPDGRSDYPTPLFVEGDDVRSLPVSDIYFYPFPYRSIELVTTHSFDLKAREDLSSLSLATDGYPQLYMDEERLFLATTQYINEWELRQEITRDLVQNDLSIDDRELIKRIQRTDTDVLPSWEKEQKVQQVYDEHVQYLPEDARQDLQDKIDERLKARLEEYESREYTIINTLLFDNGALSAGPSGKVPGSLYSQFAMDAHEGVLRVATTLRPIDIWWGGGMPIEPMMRVAGESTAGAGVAAEPAVVDAPTNIDVVDAKIAPDIMPEWRGDQTENRVYTLDEDMEIMDVLEGIAPGESIFSARFIGDRLYLVTFRQVDPFFVIDLADPQDIKMLGQLKIPGFSRYLHPYDADTIIGIGRDASTTGRQEGLKISLFDVSDVAKPEQIASWVAKDEYSQSAAEWEHKAFLFSKEKELLVIPGYSYDWQSSKNRYNGAMVFKITPDDIELRGIVDHSQGAGEWYGPQVERSLYIEDLLYTKSPTLLRINELSDLSSVKSIDLDAKSTGPYPVY